MKIFTNKSIWKKIVIALLIILMFQTIILKPVQADVVQFPGKLTGPILSLLVTLSDGIMDIIGNAIMGTSSTLYEVELGNSFLEKVGLVFVFVVAAAIAMALVVVTGGTIAALVGGIIGKTIMVTAGIGTIIAGLGAGIYASVWFNDEMLPDDLYLPMYTYSAEEIFKGNILLFDVNFFNSTKEIYAKLSDGESLKVSDYSSTAALEEEVSNGTHDKTVTVPTTTAGATTRAEDASGEREVTVPGKIEYYYYEDEDADGNTVEVKTSSQNSATMLRKTISSWYNALRNICLVLMLSVLVYIGIRMVLSSVASDKAKYLTMLKDWFVGLCLLFLMHYIMAFSVTLVEKLTDVVKTSVSANSYSVVMEAGDKLVQAVDEEHLNQPDLIQEEDGKKYLTWPTNLMGSLRLKLQMETYGAQYIGLCVCFMMLCLLTLYFTIIYLKRVLHMAFLTLIAPMVALTYCIDKLNDGKAQGFDKWFKEYVFNLLIQPMHLLLYYILITSAFEFASMNVIYSIVAIGFMTPAEKLLRSLFGFEKAQTAPGMSPAGAMMASTALNHLLHKGGRGKGGEGGARGGSSDSSSEDDAPDPTIRDNPMSNFSRNGNDNDDSQNEGPTDNIPDESNAGNNEGGQYSDEVYARSQLGPDATEEEVQAAMQNLQERRQQQQQKPKLTIPDRIKNKAGAAKKKIRNGIGSTGTGKRFLRNWDANMAAQKAAIAKAPDVIKDRIANSHPMRAAGKMAAGAVGAVAAGALGTAIAASSGDLGNLPKIGGAAAAAGYAIGSGMAGNVSSPMDDPDIKAVHDQTYNGKEYAKEAQQDYINDYKKNVKNRNYLEQKLGKKEADKMIESGEIDNYLNANVTDIKDIAAAHQLQASGKSQGEALSIARLGKMVGSDTNKMSGKTRADWELRFKDMAIESGVSKGNADKFAAQRLADLDKFYKLKS